MEKTIKFPNLLGEMAKHKMSQGNLADVLGVSRNTINKKLLGKTDWTIEEVEKICDFFKKDYYELFK